MSEVMTINYNDVPHAADTNAPGVKRFGARVDAIFAQRAELLKDRVVLDLACNTGRLAYPLLMLGAKKVVGVEARRELIDRGRDLFAKSPYAEKMTFVESDLFDYLDAAKPGDFDVIVCAGFLYHTVRHADFFRQVKRLAPQAVFVDTSVAKNYLWFGREFFGKPPALFMYVEDASKTSDTTDPDGVVYWPSVSYVEAMLRGAGYDSERVDFRRTVSDWTGLDDYKKGTRAAFVGRRR